MSNQPLHEVPPWPYFVRPILMYLSDKQPHQRRQIGDAAVRIANLTHEAANETIDSGMKKSYHRVGWAISNLTKAEWISRKAAGIYVITDKGLEWLSNNPDKNLTHSEANVLFREYWKKSTQGKDDSTTQASALKAESPTEQIEIAVETLRQSTASELLQRLRNSDPAFFENAVVKVLLAMGYGGAEQRGKTIGGTGDGGVDGVIDQDALGLEKIYVQAKRYAEGNNIGSATIREFIGSLASLGAKSGVFITTSTFSPAAIQAASLLTQNIALIDGERLVNLMIKYKVGVQTKKTYEVVDIDEDFFEDSDI